MAWLQSRRNGADPGRLLFQAGQCQLARTVGALCAVGGGACVPLVAAVAVTAAVGLDLCEKGIGARRLAASRRRGGYEPYGVRSPASLSIPVSRANLRWARSEAAGRDVTDKQCEAFFGDGMADELPAIRGVLQPYSVNIDRPDVDGDPSYTQEEARVVQVLADEDGRELRPRVSSKPRG